MLTRILGGLLCVAIGFLIVWKTRKIIDNFGTIDWAQEHLGGGGSSLMYKCIGIVIILIGFLWITNLGQAFLEATLGQLSGFKQDEPQSKVINDNQ